jgi:hypothetical protein
MPRNSKKSKGQPQFNTTFVRCELTEKDRAALVKWSEKPPMSLDDMVIEILQRNHKISYSYSEHNDSFIVSVTGKPEDCDNAGKCFTSHAKNPVKALWVAVFKFFVIFNAEPWEDAGEEADFG